MKTRATMAVVVAAGLTVAIGPLGARADNQTRATAPVVTVQNLVSDQSGAAQLTDPDLVNAWGMSHPPGGPLWVSDNGTNVSTLYTGAVGGAPVQKQSLVVNVPGGAPTGQLYNPTSGFTVPGTGMPALFVFAGENGDVSAWNTNDQPITDAVQVAHEKNAVFKGIALAHTKAGPRLLLANFHAGRIDVYNSAFHRVPSAGKFRDPQLPTGYAPFNVAVFRHRVFVTYAKQDAAAHDDMPGPGHGFLDVYTQTGAFVRRLVSHGALNSPWGMVIAPKTFGSFAGKLLVGNFGNGYIHAYGPRTGHLLGTLKDASGYPVWIDGLWGLLRGDSAAGGSNAIWFSAGPSGESHGLLGVLRAS
jgi:uncharacterized protein (TIGR03118 family)